MCSFCFPFCHRFGFSKQLFIVTFVQDKYCEALVNCHFVKQVGVCVCIAVGLKFDPPFLPVAVGRFSDP